MTTAYVLIMVESGSEFKIIRDLAQIPEIIESKITLGLFDIVCKIQTVSIESLKDIIINDIRKLRTVKETQTLLLVV